MFVECSLLHDSLLPTSMRRASYGKRYQKIAFAYDTSDRLVRETTIDSPSLGSDAPSTTSRTFEDSCPR